MRRERSLVHVSAGPARSWSRGVVWLARGTALGSLYAAAGLSAVLMVGATVVLPGALMFEVMEHTRYTPAPTILILLPSFAAVFVAMTGLLRTVDRAESALLRDPGEATGDAERFEGQLSVPPRIAEPRGRLSLAERGPPARGATSVTANPS